MAVICLTASGQSAAAPRDALETISVTAKLIPVRLLGVVPTRTIEFELTIAVPPAVGAFSGIGYECKFVDAANVELGVAARGIAGRFAFAADADGRLVSTTREDLPDIGDVTIRCRATKLEK